MSGFEGCAELHPDLLELAKDIVGASAELAPPGAYVLAILVDRDGARLHVEAAVGSSGPMPTVDELRAVLAVAAERFGTVAVTRRFYTGPVPKAQGSA